MATSHTFTIIMNDNTVKALLTGNYLLFAIQAVQGMNVGQQNLWFSTADYAQTTIISWTDEYAAFTMNSAAIPGGSVIASNNYPIQLGQQLLIVNQNGSGEIQAGTNQTAIEIQNSTTQPMLCGLSQQVGGTFSPICTIGVAPQGLDLFVPLHEITLVFATLPQDVNGVIEQTCGPGILVNYDATPLSIGYDVSNGWQAQSWATDVPDIAEILAGLAT